MGSAMNTAQALDELDRAAAAAGYAMAAEDDEAQYRAPRTADDSVARGGRVPTVQAALAALPGPTQSAMRMEPSKGIAHSAHSVRETVYGYLGLAAPA